MTMFIVTLALFPVFFMIAMVVGLIIRDKSINADFDDDAN